MSRGECATLFRRGHCLAESRIAVVLLCEHCRAERALAGRLLSDLSEAFTTFEESHRACASDEAEANG